jgi:hypothetical protein
MAERQTTADPSWGREPESVLAALAGLQRILGHHQLRWWWPTAVGQLDRLMRHGEAVPIDGPVFGVPLAPCHGNLPLPVTGGPERRVPLTAAVRMWNSLFTGSGWMGKTFEPVTAQEYAARCGTDLRAAGHFDAATCRLGRNFFRRGNAGTVQRLAWPLVRKILGLGPRPLDPTTAVPVGGQLLPGNLARERLIPYDSTGTLFLARLTSSVLPALEGRPVYQLNYRWPRLGNHVPQTRLVDEVVRIRDGVYLGQVLMAVPAARPGRRAVGSVRAPGNPVAGRPHDECLSSDEDYRVVSFFLLIDTLLAAQARANDAFPLLRARPGELGWQSDDAGA